MAETLKTVTLNQDLVRERLRQKKYDGVCISHWGHLDEFVEFIINFGIFSMLAQLGFCTGHSGIPVFILAMVAFVKPLFGIRFDDNLKYLFQDHHVMRLCGFNFKEIENGYSKRTTGSGEKPIHPDTVRNFLKSLGYAQTTGLLVKVVRKLYKFGLMRGGTYNTDTKIIFKDSPGYEFAKKVYDYKGKHRNRRGYKVSIVQHAKSKIVAAIVITSANVSDKNLLLTTVRQAITILGPCVIKTLVFDKGYWDGATLTKLKKQYGIDFIVPAKANLNVTKRLKRQARDEDFETIRKGLRIKFEKSVEDAPNYDGKLQAIVVKDIKAKKKRKSKQPVHVYLTSLTWASSIAIYKAYRERWFIENNAIKELCQYWVLEDFHCTKYNAIRAHVLICVVMFNLHVLFMSKYGRRFCEKTIAAKRAPAFEPAYVIVYVEEYFGVFEIKEYSEILGSVEFKPP
jgi:hypothetical protein